MFKLILNGFVLALLAAQGIAVCNSAEPGNTQNPIDTQALRSRTSFQEGDVFQGAVDLLDSRHNPARLTLYIKKSSKMIDREDEFDIEAIAVMDTNIARITYGIKGTYVPSWRELNLYEIETHRPLRIISTKISKGSITFEPVGLAGKLTDDDKTIHCQIAYNGNASLIRINEPIQLNDTIAAVAR